MRASRTLETIAKKYLASDASRYAIDRLGLRQVARSVYWTLFSAFRDDAVVEIGDASAAFRVGTMSEYETVEATAQTERSVLEDVLARVEPDDVFYDVGANVGVYTCLVGRTLREGTVVAFEPYPSNVARLREHVERNGIDAVVSAYALSDERDTVELAVVDSADPGTQEHSIDAEFIDHRKCVASTTIETAPGDSLVGAEDLPEPDVVKIDVEGAGLSVLDGLEETLADESCRLVYYEPHGNATEACERLRELGFEVTEVRFDKYRSDDQPMFRAEADAG